MKNMGGKKDEKRGSHISKYRGGKVPHSFLCQALNRLIQKQEGKKKERNGTFEMTPQDEEKNFPIFQLLPPTLQGLLFKKKLDTFFHLLSFSQRWSEKLRKGGRKQEGNPQFTPLPFVYLHYRVSQ